MMNIFKSVELFFKRKFYRDSETGRFVSKEYVEENPKTTETETREVRKRKKK